MIIYSLHRYSECLTFFLQRLLFFISLHDCNKVKILDISCVPKCPSVMADELLFCRTEHFLKEHFPFMHTPLSSFRSCPNYIKDYYCYTYKIDILGSESVCCYFFLRWYFLLVFSLLCYICLKIYRSHGMSKHCNIKYNLVEKQCSFRLCRFYILSFALWFFSNNRKKSYKVNGLLAQGELEMTCTNISYFHCTQVMARFLGPARMRQSFQVI